MRNVETILEAPRSRCEIDSMTPSLVDGNAIRVGSEVLIVVFGEGLIPVMNGGSGSADAEPLAEVPTFRQRRCSGVSSARQPDQPGWRARPIHVQKRYVRRVRDLYLEFFEHRSNRLEELRLVQPQSSSAYRIVCLDDFPPVTQSRICCVSRRCTTSRLGGRSTAVSAYSTMAPFHRTAAQAYSATARSKRSIASVIVASSVA